jgi:hypothetical protein
LISSFYLNLLLRVVVTNAELLSFYLNSSSATSKSSGSFSSNNNDNPSRDPNDEESEEPDSEEEENTEELKRLLELVKKAESLDKKLMGSGQNHENSYLKELNKEFSAYFDRASGNTIQQGLKEVKEYLKGEMKSIENNNNNQALDLSDTNNSNNKSSKPGDYIDELQSIEMPSIYDDLD